MLYILLYGCIVFIICIVCLLICYVIYIIFWPINKTLKVSVNFSNRPVIEAKVTIEGDDKETLQSYVVMKTYQ